MQDGFDLLIIGGGINGTAIARDAAGRGLKTLLVEACDLAGETSSASTKLIHGGLRYLEHYEFRLVREALIEREVMLRSAPHIIRPVRIVLPHHKGLRPAWLLRLGLFIYDHLGTRSVLPGTQSRNLRKAPFAGILRDVFRRGFEFSDCWADDARLVVLNALDAAGRGADIRTRTRCTALQREGDCWSAELRCTAGRHKGQTSQVRARAVVNAAGRHVDDLLDLAKPGEQPDNLRLIKGSHIIVPRLYEGEHLYMFQHDDERIIFVIPYQRDYSLIGTTDTPYDPAEGKPAISEMEISYLLSIANEYLRRRIQHEDIVSSYSGVRPLFDDKSDSASTVTRDYVFDLDQGADGNAPALLSIFGGKITTARKLAEHAMEKLSAPLGVDDAPWSAAETLPGGDVPDGDFASFAAQESAHYHWLPEEHLLPLLHRHGTRIGMVIGRARNLPELGRYFGGGLYEAEARYLVAQEWARSAEDILWRRTKCGLPMDEAQRAAFEQWLAEEYPDIKG